MVDQQGIAIGIGLQQEKERAEVTLQSIGDAVLATDRAGLVTAMNQAAERLTEWHLQDALGKPFGSVVILCNAYENELKRMVETLEDGDHHCVVMIDLDKFKPSALARASAFAECYGMMDRIDRWVIDHAIAACTQRFAPADWDALDTVSVNLSSSTPRDPSIADFIVDALRRHGMPPRYLCIEIT